MNRVDRLFNILLLLQSKQRVRAVDLAGSFGISERTIYRDIAALIEMGVPIVSLPGEGYEMMPGFYLPPLVFTPREGQALSLGAAMLAASGNYVDVAENALRKLQTALPDRTRRQIEEQTRSIRFHIRPGRLVLDNPLLVQLQNAIGEKRVVRLHYHSRSQGRTTERDIEPLELFYSDGVWYTNAYCRTRRDVRSFRADRIEQLSVLNEHFEGEHEGPPDSPTDIAVTISMAAPFARWVRERQHYGFTGEDLADGMVRMHYQINHLDEMRHWVLSWGAKVEVVSPEALRDEIRTEARKLLDILT